MALRHQVVWTRVSVTDRRNADKPVEHIFERGQLLPEWVDEYTLFVLTSGGGARAVEGASERELEAEAARLAPESAAPAVVTKQEHAPTLTQPLATQAVPVNTVDHTTGGQRPTDSAASRAGTTGEGDKPAGNASKEEWERYAVSRGLSEDDARKANRTELVRRFS